MQPVQRVAVPLLPGHSQLKWPAISGLPGRRRLPAMNLEIVNGYVCRNCTDVERAKKGEDPAKAKGPAGDIGALAGIEEPRGVNRPLAFGGRGTQVNLLL
jgi:hypothetical protein